VHDRERAACALPGEVQPPKRVDQAEQVAHQEYDRLSSENSSVRSR
jgi:hypothetical protein